MTQNSCEPNQELKTTLPVWNKYTCLLKSIALRLVLRSHKLTEPAKLMHNASARICVEHATVAMIFWQKALKFIVENGECN
jgi:hypothetical protein